ncbi:hypothetical protein LX69_00380 [Breznakibacter xylanolyticus]|uniref:Uncharacterized protein n=1 Tax=Breznakibacter xylanolyticus TaxID=990 RepID=A0A2W7NLJ2_9BACT|nr:hypothetical protein [Breznakibacter xylanolyticus]PZX20383.1 hypothetical protein LX69_00380 [Breznakibacter xylanolyticus]
MEIVSNSFIQFLGNLLSYAYIIPNIIIMVAAGMLFSKTKETYSALLLIGAILSFITSLFYAIIIPILFKFNLLSYDYHITSAYTVFNLIGLLGHLCFAIGLLLLVMSFVNNTLKNR